MSNEELFADDYHFVAIATDKMEGGDELMDDLKDDRQGGMPWMVILDGDGAELVSSNDADGKNIGCPAAPHETKHFIDMIKKSSDSTDEEIAAIDDAIQAHAKKINDAMESRREKAEAAKKEKDSE